MHACNEAALSARAFGVSLGICNVCGMNLMNNVVIRDANKKCFVVGLDCAARTDDSTLITKTESLERSRMRKVNAAKKAARIAAANAEREARIAAANAEREAREARERIENCGKTLAEIAEEKAIRDAEEERKKWRNENRWIFDVLNSLTYRSDFINGMLDSLERGPAADVIYGRAKGILAEIYSKEESKRITGKSRGKDYDEARRRIETEAYEKLGGEYR
jgi:hypothetical protein